MSLNGRTVSPGLGGNDVKTVKCARGCGTDIELIGVASPRLEVICQSCSKNAKGRFK